MSSYAKEQRKKNKQRKKDLKAIGKAQKKEWRKKVNKRNAWRVPLVAMLSYPLTLPASNLFFDTDVPTAYWLPFAIIMTAFRFADDDDWLLMLVLGVRMTFVAFVPWVLTWPLSIISPFVSFITFAACYYLLLSWEAHPIRRGTIEYEPRSTSEWNAYQEESGYQSRVWDAENDLDHAQRYGMDVDVQIAEERLRERQDEMTDYDRNKYR